VEERRSLPAFGPDVVGKPFQAKCYAIRGKVFLVSLAQLAHSDTQDATPDPTKNLPFNLGLTSKQQQQRAQVPLPYAHEG
jgi:hypothetical protein